MAVFQFLILFKFIAYLEAVKPKSVNLALETVLEFSNKNQAADLKFLDNVQQFLDKVNTVVRSDKPSRRSAYEDSKITFTEFLKSVIDILKTYDDDDLEDVFAVFDDEIRKYHYRGCKFYELLEDQNVRRFVANKLDTVKEKPASNLRENLDLAYQTIENKGGTKFLRYVNSLYAQDSNEKLKAFLINLQAYSSKSQRANLKLIKVVRDGIRSVIFDHYSALNANARRDFKLKLEMNWRNIKNPDIIKHKLWTVQYTIANYNEVHRSKTSSNVNDIKREITTPAVTPKTERGALTNPHHKQKLRSERHKNMKEGVDTLIKKNKEYVSKESTARTIKMKPSITESNIISSEFSNIEEETPHKYKSSHKKHKYVKENPLKYEKSKHASKKKSRPKKISSFITIYPEEITFNTRKQHHKESTTPRANLYTSREEIQSKKKQNAKKSTKKKPSKQKIYFRSNTEKPNIISESDTIINVNRAMPSSEDRSYKLKRRYKANSRKKTTADHYVNHKIKSNESKYNTALPMISSKHNNIPKVTSVSEEGISIESYEHKRRSMAEIYEENASVQTGLNVLRRINSIERQLEEMKNNINTKPPTLTRTDTNTLPKQTQFDLLEVWKSTAATATYNTEITTTSENIYSNLNTTLDEDISEYNTTQFETTKRDEAMQNNSHEINTTEFSFRTANETNIYQSSTPDGVSKQNPNVTVLKEELFDAEEDVNNENGTNTDIGLDKTIKKYNASNIDISETPTNPLDFDTNLIESTKENIDDTAKKQIFDDKETLSNKTTYSNDASATTLDVALDTNTVKNGLFKMNETIRL